MDVETKVLVEQLRKPGRAYGYDPVMGADISDGPGSLHVEAADLIERLSAENARLREALSGVVDDEPCHYDHHGYCQSHFITSPCEMAVARAALAGEANHD